MERLKNYLEKSSKKMNYLIIIVMVVLVASIAIPSLARYKNRTSLLEIAVWDGTVATSYRKGNGTIDDPYIISNGSELAYFAEQLTTTDYAGKYFELNNDIVLNDGIFSYNETDGIKYTKDDVDYNITPYTNTYDLGTINMFVSLNNFKGNFDGNSYTIYGLYITSETSEYLGLFTNLEGNVSNLYVENSLIYGGDVTGGIASNASSSSLKNIMYNGYIIGNNVEKTQTNVIEIEDITEMVSDEEMANTIDISIPNLNGKISNVTLTGNYTVSDEFGTLKINNQDIEVGDFELDLGTDLLSSLEVNYLATSDTTFTLSNLRYTITYKCGNSAGIIAEGNNITLQNTINKSDVYGNTYSSGLVGIVNGKTTINQSYNTGTINSSDTSSGLIGNVNQNNNKVTITNSYNAGVLNSGNNAGILAEAINNTGNIEITNVFNATSDYAIGKLSNSNVTINNSYITTSSGIKDGTLDTTFTVTTLDNLNNKVFIKNHLGFNEFVDNIDLETNQNNVWIFEDSSLPILFIDDLNNPVAYINVSTYSWNDLGYELNTLKFNSSIAFNIENADNLKPIKEVYYYINKSKTPLTRREIEAIPTSENIASSGDEVIDGTKYWQTYTNITEITDEGFYSIYAKVVDYNGNVNYLNTDLLVLDLTGAEINISLNNHIWTTTNSDLNNIYIGSKGKVEISAVDDISGVNSVYYYVTNEALAQNDLENLEESNWNSYNQSISIDKEGTSIIYVKVKDNVDYVTYANTDKIVFAGYKQTKLNAGRNMVDSTNVSITNNSSVTFNYSYIDTNVYEEGYKHKLISSILLPKNTEITLIDNVNNKVYKHTIETSEDIYGYDNSCNIDSCKVATYPFTLFNEVGKGSMKASFNDIESGAINESFSVILDFKNSNITENILDAYLYIEIQNNQGNMIRPTLADTIKKYNVYLNNSASLYLNTNYNETIDYNTDSINNIELNAGLTYSYNNGVKILDTIYEDKEIGLAIRLVDNDNNIVSKKYLKNIVFKIGDTKYFAGNDNIVRINLEHGIESVSKTLTIETYADNIKIPAGSYNFQIGILSSYDGLYSDNINYSVNIPVDITNKVNNNYNFDVIMDDTNKILNKNESVKLNFNILQKGYFNNPNIRVSLHKKDSFTAYDQNYTRIDLGSYTNDALAKYSDYIYYAVQYPMIYDGTSNTYNLFELNFNTSDLDNTGYMFVFELYDGETKIGTIQKKFIIK